MNTSSEGRSVLLAGASGLVGRECIDLLLDDLTVRSLTAVVRRPLETGVKSERLSVEQIDFDHLDQRPTLFAVDQIFCALGTTMRQAGSQSAFRRVDYEYPLRIAELGIKQGARHFLLVSALGADPKSRVFYNRVKGELEEAVAVLGYPALTIVRPSLLLGERTERRFGEEVAKRFAHLFPARLKPIHARRVAGALVQAAREDVPGCRRIESRELQEFAG
jgi:uncharacterized protein YbjT (DUF2867 family)